MRRLDRMLRNMGPIRSTPCPPVNHAGRPWREYERQVRDRFSRTVAGGTVYKDYVDLGPVTVFDEKGVPKGQIEPERASDEYCNKTRADMLFVKRHG